MVHYELILFYALGFKPTDAIKRFNVSRSSAYRMYHHYREGLHRIGFSGTKRSQKAFAREFYRILEKKVPEVIFVPFSVPPRKEKKSNDPGV